MIKLYLYKKNTHWNCPHDRARVVYFFSARGAHTTSLAGAPCGASAGGGAHTHSRLSLARARPPRPARAARAPRARRAQVRPRDFLSYAVFTQHRNKKPVITTGHGVQEHRPTDSDTRSRVSRPAPPPPGRHSGAAIRQEGGKEEVALALALAAARHATRKRGVLGAGREEWRGGGKRGRRHVFHVR